MHRAWHLGHRARLEVSLLAVGSVRGDAGGDASADGVAGDGVERLVEEDASRVTDSDKRAVRQSTMWDLGMGKHQVSYKNNGDARARACRH